jgi:hypothetical protein
VAPDSLAWNPAGTSLYVGSHGGTAPLDWSVYELDLASGTATLLYMTVDGASSQITVAEVDPLSGDLLLLVYAGGGYYSGYYQCQAVASGSCTYLGFARVGAYCPKHIQRARYAPGGLEVAWPVRCTTDDLHLYDLAAGSDTTLFTQPSGYADDEDGQIAWSEDGTTIFYARTVYASDKHEILTYDLSSGISADWLVDPVVEYHSPDVAWPR